MEHRVAVRTHWNEVVRWIHLVALFDAREWHEVMNVDEPFAHLAVGGFKVEATAFAFRLMVPDAR